ncbi:epithelial chloride channel -like protein [Labeo rohita]|uniref:Epithelial chloride channel-like protein n=1 Tax=Labeo rohita TaxID=84645 RepID=A0A498LJ19_LABRO|nr:epithelial chloride channel -like protein [Labeo rohita]
MLLSSTSTGIKLDGNGYVDVIIAISSKVPQENRLIDKIKEMVTEGSLYLYDALDKKVYFKEATILVPPHWNGTNFAKARTESFEKGPRILQQQQAATHFLRSIIEYQARVGIVLRADNGDALGDELIFLTDGMATDIIADCAPSAIQSGAIIHTLAFGNSADPALTEMANKTGGIFLSPSDDVTSNHLMDAFASLTLSTGDYTNEPVQLESAGARASDWFNGTVSVDQTVGNKTTFVIIYETTFPSIYIQSPSDLIYNTAMQLNPLEVKNFTRTDTGESFVVTTSGTLPNFPPNRITDLSAEIQEDTVLLNWTAPGEDLDQGTDVFFSLHTQKMGTEHTIAEHTPAQCPPVDNSAINQRMMKSPAAA